MGGGGGESVKVSGKSLVEKVGKWELLELQKDKGKTTRELKSAVLTELDSAFGTRLTVVVQLINLTAHNKIGPQFRFTFSAWMGVLVYCTRFLRLASTRVSGERVWHDSIVRVRLSPVRRGERDDRTPLREQYAF